VLYCTVPYTNYQGGRVITAEFKQKMAEACLNLSDVQQMLANVLAEVNEAKEAALSESDWAALERAEHNIYRGEHGANAYTDVMDRYDGGMALFFWQQAAENLSSTEGPLWDDPEKGLYRQNMIARRTAQTLAVLAFGPEFLLK
jgi:hypothetical protein